ncbi:hypothetical protein [Streptomyces sp. NPDC001833]|uniref:hypothetical protein n=1 Tax=Streptomyces sp. NPDC001833 TaxID=3154658 RepID=UPI00331B4169
MAGEPDEVQGEYDLPGGIADGDVHGGDADDLRSLGYDGPIGLEYQPTTDSITSLRAIETIAAAL